MSIFKSKFAIQSFMVFIGTILFMVAYEFIDAFTSKGSLTATEFHATPILLAAAFPAVILMYMRILAGKADEQLNIAAVAFESQNGMTITDAKNTILRVNRAFTEITGYSAEEVVGKSPRILKSGRHDANFYAAMWESITRTGGWEGEIWNRRKNGEIYPEHLSITAVKDRNGIVVNYVASVADLTKRVKAEEEIKILAFYDPLTGLPNRRLLLNRLKRALASSSRSGQEGALLFIDLDNFKTLNDTLGHDIGDMLLQQAAQRLKSCVREGDTVARLGGDEFVVMLEDLGGYVLEAAEQTKIISDKILAALTQIYHLALREYRGTASIGVTMFMGHKQTIDELLKQSDIAMYQAKKDGRNALRFFDPLMQEAIYARSTLESELLAALGNQQFHLYYQIQVDSAYRPLGAEALIRWIHPERGLVPPDQFIPLAEETGLILPIGQWVLDTACAKLNAWQQDERTRDLVLAVNVSAIQFRHADFVAQVQATVSRHAINPKLLKLELTESLLLENIEEIIATMNALHEIGIQFSLDDFGTGYSSLQYLKRLPLDQLKIDQTFVRDIVVDRSDRAIVSTIIAMAQSLNLNVIAEGVETEEQRQLLLNKGCPNFQGYLFSKPVPIAQFEALLTSVLNPDNPLGDEPSVGVSFNKVMQSATRQVGCGVDDEKAANELSRFNETVLSH
jgi:diguanylate cyclase (GGDEF)-like protein/PAS domain S-box-containing protein